jgi:uncharacterized oligopeptide transporter (OPT) family protein
MTNIPVSGPGGPPPGRRHQPFVPETVAMPEYTLWAVLLGLAMTLILGAANAYLGLRAGVTIAATYPAAVISMAVLRLKRGSILEENLARTAGSIGESVAAGAIFTLPAFVIAGVWPSFSPGDAYWKSTALMVVGSVLGVLFVSLVRRVMVEDPELPFPESVAASEIHKAGQRGAQAAKFLFYNMGLGAVIYFLGVLRLFAPDKEFLVSVGKVGESTVRLGAGGGRHGRARRRHDDLRRAQREPRVPGRGLHHRAPARGAELLGRRAGLGAARTAPAVPAGAGAGRQPPAR